jgi:uncharacterized DUF497 family protein
MNNVRVNLIKRAEMRYQGVVNPRFLAIAAAFTLTAVLLLVISVRGVQYSYRKRLLSDARLHWEQLEPRNASVRAVRDEMARQAEIVESLNARSEWATTWVDFLMVLEKTAPENVQLHRLTLSRSAVGGEGAQSRILISGISMGGSAEVSVISWRKALMNDPVYNKYFDSLELGYLRLSGRGTNGRDFELRGGREGSGRSDEAGGRK